MHLFVESNWAAIEEEKEVNEVQTSHPHAYPDLHIVFVIGKVDAHQKKG